MAKKKSNKMLSSIMVVALLLVVIVAFWQLVSKESNSNIVKEEGASDLFTSEVVNQDEEALVETEIIVSQLNNLPTYEPINNLEFSRGVNQYKQTGFIPLFIYDMKPYRNQKIANVQQIEVPLLNQQDYRWAFDTYGDDSGRIIAANGCGIVSLAMIDSYFKGSITDPGEIAAWAGLDHYVTYAGSAFTLYPAFADAYNYEVKEFYDFYEAMEEIQAGNPVVVAINPGYFSSVGHVMVIRAYEDGLVYINDPNDDGSSFASSIGHDEALMIDEGIAYWAFSEQ